MSLWLTSTRALADFDEGFDDDYDDLSDILSGLGDDSWGDF